MIDRLASAGLDTDTFLAICDAIRRRQITCPDEFYVPNPNGQLQFHQSTHEIRCLFPGNRFGKTTAMAIEANWTLQNTHRFHPRTEKRPRVGLWIAPQYRQFDILRPALERKCFAPGWSWNHTEKMYRWPNGSLLYVIPADREWTYIQGINPDIVLCDEQPPQSLWRELMTRRFGDVRTKYVIAATATEGLSWMRDEIYLPWLNHHKAQGYDEDWAHKIQNHPDTWVWARGGIADNPTASKDDVKWYETRRWSHEKERQVRLRGGFADWSGSSVFDDSAMMWMAEQQEALGPGLLGSFGALVEA